MLEKNFQILFGNYIRENWRNSSAAFELKVTKTDEIKLSVFRKHQLNSLMAAKHQKLYHKISDSSWGFKPFDAFILSRTESFGVIKFKSGVVMLDVDILMSKEKWNYKESIKKGKKLW